MSNECLEIDTTSAPEAKRIFRFIRGIGIAIAAILLAIAGGIYIYDNQENQTERQHTQSTQVTCAGSIEVTVGSSWQVVHIPPRCRIQLWRDRQDKIDIKTFPGGKLYPTGTRNKGMRFCLVEKIMLRSANEQLAHVEIVFHPLGTS